MPRKKKKEPKHRNYLVVLVMKKGVKKHRNRKHEAKGFCPFGPEMKNKGFDNE